MTHHNLPLVTIGIPTYNRADGYLTEALESALNQTYENIEIVISDNASTDHTSELIKSYHDSRIRYYKHDENIGAHNNFNYCLEQATGRYFLMLHDDDKIDRDFLETCMQRALNADNEVGVIRTGVRVLNETHNVTLPLPNRFKGLTALEVFRIYCDSAYLTFCNALFHTRKLKDLGGFQTPNYLSVDAAANLFLTVKHGSIEIEGVKATFREHASNFSNTTEIQNWVEDHYYIIEKMCEFYPDQSDKIRKYAYKYMSMKDYLHAWDTLTFPERYHAYWMIYSTYHFRFSPVSWFFKKRVMPRLKYTYLRKKIPQLFSVKQK
jgi:glycosyltransferase involved in cell wall biosynthesis